MADLRSPLAKACDEWLESDDAKTLAEGQTEGVYLRNRLQHAFLAGWNACEKARDEDDPQAEWR